ncbi:5'-methylthioadenosine/adenosylhomocysteine nucleosidase [uncultured Cetobacterium sp.]|uniref:5'-methylthioadenosine/adenosylhomocysteine nucleosidase n=2 Tax=uncultured Cetobacterium sp. TaxID=527638 RepID=UPI00261059E6|nr:5'-methylthioadenosine/adenosylhomocysteine nucleosidase [uncultured Cetobacterium sp.]
MKKLLVLLSLLGSTISMANQIAIIGAMDSEIKNLLTQMKDVTVETNASVTFHKGLLNNKKVIVFKSGIGKVNAAMSTTMALEKYDIDKIIFTGVAGAVNNKLNIADIVISKDLVQYDYDTTVFGTKLGMVPGSTNGRFIPNKELINIAKKSADKILINHKAYIGTIATGDQFIADKVKVKSLQDNFNAMAVEMEGASVAQVANLYNVPFVVIRSMSDKADGSAHMNYNEFEQIAADNSVKIVKEMLNQIN